MDSKMKTILDVAKKIPDSHLSDSFEITFPDNIAHISGFGVSDPMTSGGFYNIIKGDVRTEIGKRKALFALLAQRQAVFGIGYKYPKCIFICLDSPDLVDDISKVWHPLDVEKVIFWCAGFLGIACRQQDSVTDFTYFVSWSSTPTSDVENALNTIITTKITDGNRTPTTEASNESTGNTLNDIIAHSMNVFNTSNPSSKGPFSGLDESDIVRMLKVHVMYLIGYFNETHEHLMVRPFRIDKNILQRFVDAHQKDSDRFMINGMIDSDNESIQAEIDYMNSLL